MKLEKLIKLKEILDFGTYSIDFTKCEIVNNNSGEYVGYIQKSGRSKTGVKTVGLWHEKKTYNYSVAEIIMAELGHLTAKNCEKMIVENITKNARNTHYSNLRLMTRSDLCKLSHRKKIISAKPLKPHQQKPLEGNKVNDIIQLKIMGFRSAEICKITDLNKHTVKKYFYKKKAI